MNNQNKIDRIDEVLSQCEDILHGRAGEEVTEARKLLSQLATNGGSADVSSRLVRGPHIQNELLCGFCNGNGLDAGQEYCKPCRGTGLDTQKFLRVADLRDVEGQHFQEKISYSRMVEILNKKATKFMYEWIRERIVARENVS